MYIVLKQQRCGKIERHRKPHTSYDDVHSNLIMKHNIPKQISILHNVCGV